MLSTDRTIFEKGSAAQERMAAYGKCFDELTIWVGSLRGNEYEATQISDTVWAYPIHWRSNALLSSDVFRVIQKGLRAHIVTAQDPVESGIPGWIMAKLAQAKLHVQVHTDFLSPQYHRFTKRNKLHTRLAGFVLRRANRIRVVSERIRESIIAQYGIQKPISVLPIFVDVERFRTIQHEKHPRFGTVFLAVGRLEKEKNFDIAIRAVRDARERGHDVGLIVVGSGSQEAMLKEEAALYQLQEFVTFVGYQADTLPYYALADVVLVPSEYEGFGMNIVEALAAKIPVIATDVGIAQEAGAIIADKHSFSSTVIEWLMKGSRTAELLHHPYASFDEYVRRYCDEIRACVSSKEHTSS